MAITLRPYQAKAIQNVRSSLMAGNRAPLLVSPTGSGKTVMLSKVAAGAEEKGSRAYIIAHRGELLEQISNTLMSFGIRHGMISPDYTPDPFARVQVASVQTLIRRATRQNMRADLVIFDEAHHVLEGNMWGKALALLGKPRVLGVTATPCRGDGRGLGLDAGGIFDDMIEVASVRELIDGGHLVRPVVYAPVPQSLDLSGIKTRAGDYERAELSSRMDTPTITGDAVGHYARLCPGVPAIAFGVSIEHCQHIAAEFRAAGFNFQPIDGTMDSDTRKGLIRGLGNGIDGLVSADLIGEGVDVPAVGAVILLRPTKSLGLYLQQVGRGLRTCAGKTHAVILDHVGNTLIHGLPEEDREWSLEGMRKKTRKGEASESVPVKQCPVCYAVHSPAPACPMCAHAYLDETARGGPPEQAPGELKEVTAELAAKLRAEKQAAVRGAKSLEELRLVAARLGYKAGWADHVWAARQSKRQAPRQYGGF